MRRFNAEEEKRKKRFEIYDIITAMESPNIISKQYFGKDSKAKIATDKSIN